MLTICCLLFLAFLLFLILSIQKAVRVSRDDTLELKRSSLGCMGDYIFPIVDIFRHHAAAIQHVLYTILTFIGCYTRMRFEWLQTCILLNSQPPKWIAIFKLKNKNDSNEYLICPVPIPCPLSFLHRCCWKSEMNEWKMKKIPLIYFIFWYSRRYRKTKIINLICE